jgi:hypothetical protein
MNVYEIVNRQSGESLGAYEADDEQGALDALARDAGYKDDADMCRQVPRAADEIRVMAIQFSPAAQANVDETGSDVAADIAALRSRAHTRESLLAHCLDGADEDRAEGWREYVAAVCEAAGV